jgi:nitric oxide reductase subunit B
MINPPIALFYMQGLNTTAVHAHGAFFGVYGMLALGLTLMGLRALQADREWKEGLLGFSFWAMNAGLMYRKCSLIGPSSYGCPRLDC